MLIGVPRIIPPELLSILCQMGHGDEITFGDANFPGHSCCKTVVHMDGASIPEILEAVLRLIPLDTYSEHPVSLMRVAAGDTTKTPVWDTYKEIVSRYDPRGADCFEEIERFDFYDKVRRGSFAVVMSGETATYANIILKKGVIR